MTPPRLPRSLTAALWRRAAAVAGLTAVALGALSGCAAAARAPTHASAPASTVHQAPARRSGVGAPSAPACVAQTPSPQQVAHALDVAQARLSADAQTLHPGQFPSITGHAGLWRTSPRRGWTSGFFPGSLWLMDQYTRRSAFARAAAAWTQALAPQATVTRSHDIGFEIFTSFGNGYRLTRNEAYRQVILRAAASLATRYDAAVGAVRSWGARTDSAHFLVIVDGLMNLETLFWAAQHGGARAWQQMAIRDALTVRDHFIRPDGSLVHMVDFDPLTGAVQSEANPQGADLASTWARGQSWAVAGFTIAYAQTHDARFLQAAQRTAAYFLDHLPSDCVPYWDFQAPGIPDAPRDSSAAAIAADGLITLSRLDPNPARASSERSAGGGLLTALITRDLAPQGQALLAHGTANKPGGSFDTGTSYGDYYFLDALLRYRGAGAS